MSNVSALSKGPLGPLMSCLFFALITVAAIVGYVLGALLGLFGIDSSAAEGPAGAAGAAGVAGLIGAVGPAGPTGPVGPPGHDGSQGPAGKDGAPGVDGKDGAPGVDGKDGRVNVRSTYAADYALTVGGTSSVLTLTNLSSGSWIASVHVEGTTDSGDMVWCALDQDGKDVGIRREIHGSTTSGSDLAVLPVTPDTVLDLECGVDGIHTATIDLATLQLTRITDSSN